MDWSSYAKRLIESQNKQALQAGYAVTPEAVEELKDALRFIKAHMSKERTARHAEKEELEKSYAILKKYSPGYGGARYREGYRRGDPTVKIPTLEDIDNPDKPRGYIPGDTERKQFDRYIGVSDPMGKVDAPGLDSKGRTRPVPKEDFDYSPEDLYNARRRVEFLEKRRKAGERINPESLREAREEYERLGGDEESWKHRYQHYEPFHGLSPEQQRRFYDHDQNNQGAFNQYMSGINPLA